MFGGVAFGAIAIFADAHVDEVNPYVGLLQLPAVLALLFAIFRRKLLLLARIFPLKAFAVALVLAVIGDVDGGGVTVEARHGTNGTHAFEF